VRGDWAAGHGPWEAPVNLKPAFLPKKSSNFFVHLHFPVCMSQKRFPLFGGKGVDEWGESRLAISSAVGSKASSGDDVMCQRELDPNFWLLSVEQWKAVADLHVRSTIATKCSSDMKRHKKLFGHETATTWESLTLGRSTSEAHNRKSSIERILLRRKAGILPPCGQRRSPDPALKAKTPSRETFESLERVFKKDIRRQKRKKRIHSSDVVSSTTKKPRKQKVSTFPQRERKRMKRKEKDVRAVVKDLEMHSPPPMPVYLRKGMPPLDESQKSREKVHLDPLSFMLSKGRKWKKVHRMSFTDILEDAQDHEEKGKGKEESRHRVGSRDESNGLSESLASSLGNGESISHRNPDRERSTVSNPFTSTQSQSPAEQMSPLDSFAESITPISSGRRSKSVSSRRPSVLPDESVIAWFAVEEQSPIARRSVHRLDEGIARLLEEESIS
jgi:hypothetical protein